MVYLNSINAFKLSMSDEEALKLKSEVHNAINRCLYGTEDISKFSKEELSKVIELDNNKISNLKIAVNVSMRMYIESLIAINNKG